VARRTSIVTGGAGFIGSHLADALLAAGDSVVVIDDLSSGRTDLVPSEAQLETVSVTDLDAVDAVVGATRPARIFHLAAQASVTASVTDPYRDCEVNVQGTLNVLEAARRHRSPVVFASTGGALYGNDAPLPTSESQIPAPLSPYGASKWAAEAYVVTWAHANDVPHTVCRLGNVYGPRQSPHGEAGVVAIFSYQLWHGETPTMFGFGRPTRDYIHVADVVRALLAASGVGGVFNVATGQETSVREVFDVLQSAAGTNAEPALAPLRAGELERSCLDPGRAGRELGWKQEIEVGEGLRTTYRELAAEFSTRG
jgi:UDP-glucose 4-epimerase